MFPNEVVQEEVAHKKHLNLGACSSSLYFLDTAARSWVAYRRSRSSNVPRWRLPTATARPCQPSPGSADTSRELEALKTQAHLANKGAFLHLAHFYNQQPSRTVGAFQREVDCHACHGNDSSCRGGNAPAHHTSAPCLRRRSLADSWNQRS